MLLSKFLFQLKNYLFRKTPPGKTTLIKPSLIRVKILCLNLRLNSRERGEYLSTQLSSVR